MTSVGRISIWTAANANEVQIKIRFITAHCTNSETQHNA